MSLRVSDFCCAIHVLLFPSLEMFENAEVHESDRHAQQHLVAIIEFTRISFLITIEKIPLERWCSCI